MSRLVRLAKIEEADTVQLIFNDPRNAEFLGGFTMLEPIKSKIEAGGTAVVVEDGVIIAADETGRDGFHRMKLQLVGVTNERKRTRAATALYTFWSLQCAMEGRFQMVDTIIQNNCIMPFFLPKMGFVPAVTMRSKVRRHHDMTHWDGNPLDSVSAGIDRLAETGVDITFALEWSDKKAKNLGDSIQQLINYGFPGKAAEVSDLANAVKGQFL